MCRWSLIAGRLPGRTANDVKNFWNTHFQKKLNIAPHHLDQQKINNKFKAIEITNKHIIIRPQPRKLSSAKNNNASWYCNNKSITKNTTEGSKGKMIMEKPITTAEASTKEHDNVEWWASLLLAANCNDEFAVGSSTSPPLKMTSNEERQKLFDEEILLPEISEDGINGVGTKIGWSDFSADLDVDLWGLLN
ncbi:hypothetical protein RND71_035725 [Anisodus tanguticus]|uniref:Uncharacterized protein n=1 Tax=Anisodus tanguticus TaxID=243964 RepID=A0AAE1V1T4_9SOLA|nr:hypothetical protein RND71_035725 [Anisodus tanguticus]